ncbi:MAG: metal ABC transporter permease, partial [Paracoccaceae bacterium]
MTDTSAPKPASGWHTIRRVGPYLWPAGQTWIKRRVVLALSFLVVAKLISVTTPYIYKLAVDALGGAEPTAAMAMMLTAVGLTVAYGMARLGVVLFAELRDAVFVRVGQR